MSYNKLTSLVANVEAIETAVKSRRKAGQPQRAKKRN